MITLFLIHLLTAIIIFAIIFISYKITLKFKGGLISKFFKYIIYGSIPTILYHINHARMVFSMPAEKHSLFEILVEHGVVLFLFLMILIGVIIVFQDYKGISTKKNRK